MLTPAISYVPKSPLFFPWFQVSEGDMISWEARWDLGTKDQQVGRLLVRMELWELVVPSALCSCWPSPETALIRLACGEFSWLLVEQEELVHCERYHFWAVLGYVSKRGEQKQKASQKALFFHCLYSSCYLQVSSLVSLDGPYRS